MLKFYNSLGRNISEFKTIENGKAKVYCCGPTVYNFAHIGNLRSYIFEDILVRTMRLSGLDVNHTMNITDVGHLTSDADSGDDKMVLAAEKEKLSVLDVARKYEDAFFKDCAKLNIIRPNTVCRATEHINEMIDFVKGLEEKGFTYSAGGNIYFDTSKYKEYGKLTGQNRDELMHGARVEEDKNKKNPADFVLWFTVSKFENHILQWDSPWGKGYPGWHIECSAMSMKHLGSKLDIHCGGIDNMPVHHENEIAQSESLTGEKWCNYWMHGQWLNLKGGKMSKSKGGFLTVASLEEKGFNPIAFRYLCLTAHYRSLLAFDFESLEASQTAYNRLVKRYAELSKQNDDNAGDDELLNSLKEKFKDFLFDDLKVPQALTVLWEAVKNNELSAKQKIDFIDFSDTVLGLNVKENAEKVADANSDIPEEVVALAEQRKQAKLNKDWVKSDEIRDKITALGYTVKDGANGSYEITKS